MRHEKPEKNHLRSHSGCAVPLPCRLRLFRQRKRVCFFCPLQYRKRRQDHRGRHLQLTEVNILGELYTELIEANTDYTVDQRFGLAGAAVCFDALEQGSIDMFVEYTGTALMNLLAQPMNTDKDVVWQTVSDMMMKDHNIYTSAPLGFNNTYVMSVKPETAEAYGLTTLSDLIEKSPELRLGCTVEFIQREDCLPLLESQYNAEFKDVTGLDASLRYTAIENDEVDVVDAFATDALLSKLGLTTLEDDLGFFPPYYAVNFVNADLIQSDPALAEVLSSWTVPLTRLPWLP